MLNLYLIWTSCQKLLIIISFICDVLLYPDVTITVRQLLYCVFIYKPKWYLGLVVKLLLSGVDLMLSQKNNKEKKVELMIQILPNLKKKKKDTEEHQSIMTIFVAAVF